MFWSANLICILLYYMHVYYWRQLRYRWLIIHRCLNYIFKPILSPKIAQCNLKHLCLVLPNTVSFLTLLQQFKQLYSTRIHEKFTFTDIFLAPVINECYLETVEVCFVVLIFLKATMYQFRQWNNDLCIRLEIILLGAIKKYVGVFCIITVL